MSKSDRAVISAAAIVELTTMTNRLAQLDVNLDEAAQIDAIRKMEELRGTLAAAQARMVVAFDVSHRATQKAAGVPAARVGRGVAAQIALARRSSHHETIRYLGNARIFTRELPCVFAQLQAGLVSEWQVSLVAQHTAWLSVEHRAIVDAEVAPQLPDLGILRSIDAVKKIAYRLDPRGFVDRLAAVEKDRHVSLRPAPDCMARLSAFTTIPQGVSARAALEHAARDALARPGETRTRSQIMADTLIERVTGQATAGDVPVTVNLIMTDRALFGDAHHDDSHDPAAGGDDASANGLRTADADESAGANASAGADIGASIGADVRATRPMRPAGGAEEPAYLIGGGVIPAGWARRLLLDPSADTMMFLRRLYAHPRTGQLVAMDSRARRFPKSQRKFMILRDQICRTPYCGAPVRHADHVTPHADGGETCIACGQGLCEACNYAKQAIGWHQRVDRDGTIITTTPTGHVYRSRLPDPPGCLPAPTAESESGAARISDAA